MARARHANGCQRAHKQGAAACGNRLTIRAKIADTALLAELQLYLSRPDTISYLADAMSTRLNALIHERPRLRALKVAERDTLRQKLAHLITAIQEGGGSAGLVSAMRTRGAELTRLEADLAELAEPIADRLAVIPSWYASKWLMRLACSRGHRNAQNGSFSGWAWGFLDSSCQTKARGRSGERSEPPNFRGFWRGQEPTY